MTFKGQELEILSRPLNLLTSLFERQIVETYSKYPEEIEIWEDTIKILWAIDEATKSSTDNIVDLKIMEWQRNMLWAMTAVYGAAYEIAIRELRFLIEDVIQSLYIDIRMEDTPLSSKIKVLSILDDSRFSYYDVISKLRKDYVPDSVCNAAKKLYQELSGYVHPSEEVIRSSLEDGRFVYLFIEDIFQRCIALHKRTYDSVIVMIISSKQSTSLDKETFFNSAKPHLLKHDYSLTLTLE